MTSRARPYAAQVLNCMTIVMRQKLLRFQTLVAAAVGVLRRELLPFLRPDRICAVIAGFACLIFLLMVPRSTENALKLAAFVNDEPALTMSLAAMTKRPFGNPANFDSKAIGDPKGPGPEWHFIRYSGFNYYGGVYLGLGFAAFAPLKLIGAPTFPIAPIILRVISALAAVLSLIVLYNLARSVGREFAGHAGSRVIGAASVLFLLGDSHFYYYASIIHPDTLQLLLGLLGVVMAIQYARSGDRASLVALGIVVGLSQGTKLGAMWFLPTMLLSIYYSLGPSLDPRKLSFATAGQYARRLVLLGVTSIAVWLLSTPYAVLDKYYFNTNFVTLQQVATPDSLATGGLTKLIEAFHAQFGPVISLLFWATLIWALARLALGRLSRPLVLMLLTAVSQILWFGFMNQIWVMVGYCLVAYGLLAVLAGLMLADLVRAVATPMPGWRRPLAAAVLLACGLQLVPRIAELLAYTTNQLLRDRATVIAANRWFQQQAVPRDASIVWDDIAYVDPNVFPKARMHGGLLRWKDLRGSTFGYPDYIILSSSIYDSPWWAEQISKQRIARNDEQNLSIRLYQDLLGRPDPARHVAWIEHLHTIKSDVSEQPSVVKWQAPPVVSQILGPLAINPVMSTANAGLRLRWLVARFAASNEIVTGPELRIFRINSTDSACPRERAFTNAADAPGMPFFAFDGQQTVWAAPGKGASLEGTYLAVDFGCHTEQGGETIQIAWVDPASTPAAIRVEASKDGSTWQLVAAHAPDHGPAVAPGKIETIKLDRPVKARYWRIVADRVPPARGFAVRDVIIPE